MTDRQPYSRVYWSIRSDPKFVGIYGNDSHLAAWLRLLIAADATWPAPADIPANAKRASVKALADCGLIDLRGPGLFTVHGLDAERGRRKDAATRLSPDRPPSGSRSGGNGTPDASLAYARTSRDSRDETRRAKGSQDEPTAREVGPSDEEMTLFQAIAKAGAFIRPESGLGLRVMGLIERQGAAEVRTQLDRLVASAGRKLSDRQIVFGLEAALEAVPGRTEAREADIAEQTDSRARRRQAEVDTRRLEWFRNTGKWDEAWGPQPESVA